MNPFAIRRVRNRGIGISYFLKVLIVGILLSSSCFKEVTSSVTTISYSSKLFSHLPDGQISQLIQRKHGSRLSRIVNPYHCCFQKSRTSMVVKNDDESDDVEKRESNQKFWPPWPFNLIGRSSIKSSSPSEETYNGRDLDLFWTYFIHRLRTSKRQIQEVCSEISYHFPPAFPALMVALIPGKVRTSKIFGSTLGRVTPQKLALFSLGISVLSWTNYELCKKKQLATLPLKDIYVDYKRAILPPFLPQEAEAVSVLQLIASREHDSTLLNDQNQMEEGNKNVVDDVDTDNMVVDGNSTMLSLPMVKKQLKNFYRSAPKPSSFGTVFKEWKRMREIRQIEKMEQIREQIKEQLLTLQQLKRNESNKIKMKRKKRKSNFIEEEKELPLGYALVTGASSGIGRAIAVELARFEVPLILVARNLDRLTDLANDLEACYGVKCCVIQADLSTPDTAKRLYETTKNAGLHVDILVNNAGICNYGEVVESEDDDISKLIHLNVGSMAMLSKFYGKDMKDQRRGRMLIVSSVVGITPSGPNIATYAATKSFDRSFSLSLGKELEPYGVGVTCLMPGAVKTHFNANSGTEEAVCWKYPFYVMSAPKVAQRGVRALFAGDPEVCPGWQNRVFAKVLTPLLPQRLISMVVGFSFSPLNIQIPDLLRQNKNYQSPESSSISSSEKINNEKTNQLNIFNNKGNKKNDMPPRILSLHQEEEILDAKEEELSLSNDSQNEAGGKQNGGQNNDKHTTLEIETSENEFSNTHDNITEKYKEV